MDGKRLELLAKDLRAAAFPGASSWTFCAADVRERWIRAAELADGRAQRAVDQAYRKATAAAHECGQHAAAKAIRELRVKEEAAA